MLNSLSIFCEFRESNYVENANEHDHNLVEKQFSILTNVKFGSFWKSENCLQMEKLKLDSADFKVNRRNI